jgi:NADPH-dependent ferric siderophore reductase
MGTPQRTRRPPAPFRRIHITGTRQVTGRMIGVTVAGSEMEGFSVEAPASSVRLLLPTAEGLTIPNWNGNEFLLQDGTRPALRTLTPVRFDPSALELDLEIVLHEGGLMSAWALSAKAGDPVALSGPGRGTTIDQGAREWLIAGDESAIPAMCQVIETLPVEAVAHVIVEIEHHDARHPLPDRPVRVEWLVREPGSVPGSVLTDAVQQAEITAGVRVWAAGEAASMQLIRRYLFDEREIPRQHTIIRGYWKHERAGS